MKEDDICITHTAAYLVGISQCLYDICEPPLERRVLYCADAVPIFCRADGADSQWRHHVDRKDRFVHVGG